jgi:hypothetical protein
MSAGASPVGAIASAAASRFASLYTAQVIVVPSFMKES